MRLLKGFGLFTSLVIGFWVLTLGFSLIQPGVNLGGAVEQSDEAVRIPNGGVGAGSAVQEFLPARDDMRGSQMWTFECELVVQKPSVMTSACADFGEQVRNIVWDQWDKGHGVGRGIYSVNDCDPDCADGTLHETPVTVELGDVTKVGSKYFLNTFSFVSKNGEALGVGKGSSGTWDISEFYRMVPGMHEGA